MKLLPLYCRAVVGMNVVNCFTARNMGSFKSTKCLFLPACLLFHVRNLMYRLRTDACFEVECIGLYWNVQARLKVKIILLFVWISSSRHYKISNLSTEHPSPVH